MHVTAFSFCRSPNSGACPRKVLLESFFNFGLIAVVLLIAHDLAQTRIDNSKGQWVRAAAQSFQGDLEPIKNISLMRGEPL